MLANCCVTLTHFINPHLFWCYKVDVPNENYAKIFEEEKKLESLYDYKNGRSLVSQVTVGAKVAVKYLLWRKFIRAEVVEVVNNKPHFGEYVVWAIDYGFLLQTKMEYIIGLLPESSDLTIDHIICAGIANVEPAVSFYDMVNSSWITERRDQWSQRACKALHTALQDATIVEWVDNFTIGNKCWGDLKITDELGHQIMASEFLLKLKAAVRAGPDFRETSCLALSETQIVPLWPFDNGTEIKTNIRPDSDPVLAHDQSVHVDKITQRKIADWRLRNNQDSGEYLNDQHDSDTDDGVVLDEITCEDSVSMKEFRDKAETTNMDDHELGDFIGLRGAQYPQQRSTLDAFELNAPPKVEAHASDINDQLTQAESSCTTAIVAYRRKLLEQKKNIALKQLGINQTDVSSNTSHETCTKNDKEPHTRQNTAAPVEQALGSTPAIRTAAVAASPPMMSIASSSADSRVRQQQFEVPQKQKGQTPSNCKDSSDEKSAIEKGSSMHPSQRLVKVFETRSVLFDKVPFEMPKCRKAAYPDFSKIGESTKEQQIYHEVNSLRMVPAGFDLSRLNQYKNESNHWHRKTTTRYDKVRHDNETMRKPFKRNCDTSEEQNIRFGRGHRDKNQNAADDTSKELAEKSHTTDAKHINKNKTKIMPHAAELDSKENLDSSNRLESLANKLLAPQQKRSDISEFEKINQIEKIRNQVESESDLKRTAPHPELTESSEPKIGIKSELSRKDFLDIGKPTTTKPFANSITPLRSLKEVDHLVLAHSQVPLQTLSELTEANFAPQIHERLSFMKVSRAFRLQAYAWPHLLRGNSLLTVSPKRSGKTWAYLPPLCTLVGFRTRRELTKGFGPVAIVLVATSKCVDNVTVACRSLMGSVIKSDNGKSEMSVVPCVGLRTLQVTKQQLFHGCGVLVATPPSLLRLLRGSEHQSLIDPARLKMLVIDDLDQMVARTSHEFRDVMREIFKIAPKTANGTLVPQVVLTSRLWFPMMIGLLRRCNQPLLLIGDHLEAALYGQAMLSVKFGERNTKLATILKFIEEDSRHSQSLLIMCGDDSDVVHIVQVLTQRAYSCIGYTSQSSAAERVNALEWKKRLNRNQILVCSDDNFAKLQLQTAQNLIHYSFSTSWTKFMSRFAALLCAYENRIANGFAATYPNNSAESRKSQAAVNSLILLDENSFDQVPQLVYFLQRHKLEHLLPPEISKANQNALIKREDCRSARGALMCPGVLEFGDCDEPQCAYRHKLMPSDKIPPNGDIPVGGELRLLILQVFSPCHYSARLLQHKAPGATEWREWRQSNDAGSFTMKLGMYYANAENRLPYSSPKVNDLCIYRTDEQGYQRARIIEVPALQATNVKLCLKLIDVGCVEVVKSNDLLVCAEQFRNFPPLAVEIRLSGVRPLDNDRTWDRESRLSVTKWIMTDNADIAVHVRIHFALANTVWVRSVNVMERLPTLARYICRIDVKKSLLKEQMAVLCPCDDSNGIYAIALKNELIDDGARDADAESDALNATTKSDCQDDEAVAADYTSTCSQQLSSDTDFEDATNKTVDDKPQMRSPEPVESSAAAKPHSIRRSTAIATETWCELPADEMHLIQINANGDWSEIYLSSLDLTPSSKRRYEELVALIEEHVRRQKTEATKLTFSLLPMQNYILKYRDVYSRAKLYSVCDGMHRFLLCDLAIFVNVHVRQLWRDCVYETSEEIIAYAPYNSIHCTLAGIKCRYSANGEECTKALSKIYQYVCAVGENVPKTETDSPAWHKLGMRSFCVLLYECDKRDDFIGATMLNKVLLERGAASRDPDTEHFLEHSPGVDFSDFDLTDTKELIRYDENNDNGSDNDVAIVKVEDLLKCLARSCQLDGDNDGVEFAKQLLMATELKPTAKQAITDKEDKKKKQPIVATARAELKKSKARNEYSSPKESTFTSCEGSSANSKPVSSTSASSVPRLIRAHKCPPTTWYETKCLIYLKIHAPDVDDYYLSVNADTVHFNARVNDEQRVLLLYLLGTVEPQYTTHKIRGLNVVVQLVKSVHMMWPRLLHQPTKFAWLTYDLNALETMEEPHLPAPIHPNQLAAINGYEDDSDDEDASERHLLTTYTPINNEDDDLIDEMI